MALPYREYLALVIARCSWRKHLPVHGYCTNRTQIAKQNLSSAKLRYFGRHGASDQQVSRICTSGYWCWLVVSRGYAKLQVFLLPQPVIQHLQQVLRCVPVDFGTHARILHLYPNCVALVASGEF